MKSAEIREKFLRFFEEKGHKRVPSSSLVPADPTVLLTLAGMLQFKPVFLGIEKPKYKRATTVQKCIRMNDVTRVGRTSRHHTFFEMLGNFSFGDYFKKEAIEMAWELLTKEFKLSENRLLIAIYEKDNEAYDIWNKTIKIPENRIFKLGEDNNFWAAGATGPCGPCSEIYYDLGDSKGCGKKDCAPGCDCDRFLELWNLVFIEFNRDEKGMLHQLPSKNIDTGMGLERIASVLQGVSTNFDTDIFIPIINALRALIKDKMTDEHHPGQSIISERIIADHIRAITHMIADGILPSNEGRGYVLRSLIRRAVRYGRLLSIKEAFLYKLSNTVVDVNGIAYSEIKEQAGFIAQIIMIEEEHFGRTLEQGMVLLGDMIKKCVAEGRKNISGKDAFVLHDTFGFPFDLTVEIASESNLEVAGDEFRKEMDKQKQRGKSAGIGMGFKEKLQELSKYGPTKFLGYSSLSDEAKILHIDEKDNLVILDKTPFYPESGGQSGDTGKFMIKGSEINVIDTFGNIDGVIVHKMDDLKNLKVKMTIKAVVDKDKRDSTAKHHTATHLIQAALRELLGKQVRQTGSLVTPERFRFDFTHFGEISNDDLEKLERRVNEKIKEKIKVDVQDVTLEEARKRGATMLFDEKYGEKVRLVVIDDFSKELCGGTHVNNISDIDFFKILSESAISAGVRRIEAKTADSARNYLNGTGKQLWDANKHMFVSYEALELKKGLMVSKPDTYYQFFRITKEEMDMFTRAVNEGNILLINRMLEDFRKKNIGLQERVKELEKEARKIALKTVGEMTEQYEKDAVIVGDIMVIKDVFRGRDMEFLREASDLIRNKIKRVVSILFSVHEDKVSFVLSLSKELLAEQFNASEMAKEAAIIISGSGGGRLYIAEAGGRDPSKVNVVIEKVVDIIKKKKGIQ